MTRIVAPDKGVRETTIDGSAYKPSKGGVYSVESPSHIKAMKREGFFEASLNPISSGDSKRGFTCSSCGFGSWFKKCSRCGTESGD